MLPGLFGLRYNSVTSAAPVSCEFTARTSLPGVTTRKCFECTTLGRSMNGLRAGMSAAPLMAAARVAAGVTSLTCHIRTFELLTSGSAATSNRDDFQSSCMSRQEHGAECEGWVMAWPSPRLEARQRPGGT